MMHALGTPLRRRPACTAQASMHSAGKHAQHSQQCCCRLSGWGKFSMSRPHIASFPATRSLDCAGLWPLQLVCHWQTWFHTQQRMYCNASDAETACFTAGNPAVLTTACVYHCQLQTTDVTWSSGVSAAGSALSCSWIGAGGCGRVQVTGGDDALVQCPACPAHTCLYSLNSTSNTG